MNTKYISAADTAKLIRTQLKNKFPNVKFYIRSKTYSGGASIDIDYVNGPTKDAVEATTRPFNGSGFDGMNDYKTSNEAYLLLDGSAQFAQLERYNGENITFPEPPSSIRVSFGADYIFVNRHYTPEAAKPIIKAVCDDYGKPEPKYYESHPFFGPKQNLLVTVLDWDGLSPNWGNEDQSINHAIHEALNTNL